MEWTAGRYLSGWENRIVAAVSRVNVFGILGLLLIVGCSPAPDVQLELQACVEPEGSQLTGDLKPGTYRFTLVVMGGAKAAAVRANTLKGRMWLFPQDSALINLQLVPGEGNAIAEMPLYGATDVDFVAAGAVDTGDPMSRDPARPGVAVLVQRHTNTEVTGAATTHVTLRIGAKANRRGINPFDGGYNVLRVSHISQKKFAGTWVSGTLTVVASGYFCAALETG